MVSEIVVDDATRGISQRYVELQLADGTLVPLQGQAAEPLAQGAHVEVGGRHRGKPLEIATARSLPRGRDAEPRDLTEVDGTLAVLHADYFADDKSAFIYEVHDFSGKALRLRMGSMPASLRTGMKVRVADA